MKIYLDVYNEVREALPWATEEQLRALAYENWKAQNEKQPTIKVEAPKAKPKTCGRKPRLRPMSSDGRGGFSDGVGGFKLCGGRKIHHVFICNLCGMGRSFGYRTPYGTLCPRCAARKAGGRGAPHCYTTAMRG